MSVNVAKLAAHAGLVVAAAVLGTLFGTMLFAMLHFLKVW